MRKSRKERGVATFVALLVLSILTVIIFAIGAQGVWNMNYVKIDMSRKSAFEAAEAGLAESLLKYKKQETHWDQGVGSAGAPLSLSTGPQYYVQVFKPDTPNPPVPVEEGTLYFLGTGIDNQVTQRVGIKIRDTSSGSYRYAIASAGDISVKNTNVYGSIKCSGNLLQTSNVDIYPEEIRDTSGIVTGHADGRLLVTAQIQNGPKQINIMNDNNSNTKQDVRARNGATGPSKISGADPLVLNDTTSDTLAFITDGGTTPNTDPTLPGERLPNPDMSTLLAGAINHGSEVPSSSTVYSAPITGGVHYFPNGVTLTSTITGDCTIIAGKTGSPGRIIYNSNAGTSVQINLIAIDGADGAVGGANIRFPNNCALRGVVFSHGSVTTQGSFDLIGTCISYNGDQSHTNAQSTFKYDQNVLQGCPGFESFFGGGAPGTVSIISWQKL